MINMRKCIQRGIAFAVCFLFAWLYMSNAQAAIFSFITKSTPYPNCDPVNEVCVNYHYKISAWTSEADNQPSPCRDQKVNCIIFVGHKHYANGTSGSFTDNDFGYIDIAGLKTIGDVRKKVLSLHPLPITGVVLHEGKPVTNECVAFFVGHEIAEQPIFPTSICGIAPPPTGHCEFSTKDVTLNYGSVTPESLSGKQISAVVTVSCSTSMNLEARLINPQDGSDIVPLRADGSLSAKMTLDGEDASSAGKAFSVQAGGSAPLTVTSEAVVSGTPEAGDFSGSAVLFLSIP
ncbi:hypothetical protein SB912_18955 [Pantoea sp. SIMBA_072]